MKKILLASRRKLFGKCHLDIILWETLGGQNYSEQTNVFQHHKTHATNCLIYWLSAKLGSKNEIEICKYIKYDVSALVWVKISNFLVFREVLIY